MFKAFKECPYNELKVIIMGQEPYSQINVADGIAFSCSKATIPSEIQECLNFILQEINKTVYNGECISNVPDLTRWSNQGILMLNTALTAQIGKINQHYSIWKTFLNYLFDYLTNYNTGLVYIYLGKEAKNWESSVGINNYKFFGTHPISAIYSKSKKWDSELIFVKTTEIVKNNHNYIINW